MTGKAVIKGRGRKPKPTREKVMSGNPGKRKLNDAEPEYPKIHNIEPPEGLSPEIESAWRAYVPRLCGNGVITEQDVHNIHGFFFAYQRWHEAQQEISAHGVMILDNNDKYYKNPATTVANECSRQMTMFGALIGFDPSSRQALVASDKPEENNPYKDM